MTQKREAKTRKPNTHRKTILEKSSSTAKEEKGRKKNVWTRKGKEKEGNKTEMRVGNICNLLCLKITLVF